MTAGLQLMKNALTSLAKSVLIPWGSPAEISAADAAILLFFLKKRGLRITALI